MANPRPLHSLELVAQGWPENQIELSELKVMGLVGCLSDAMTADEHLNKEKICSNACLAPLNGREKTLIVCQAVILPFGKN